MVSLFSMHFPVSPTAPFSTSPYFICGAQYTLVMDRRSLTEK